MIKLNHQIADVPVIKETRQRFLFISSFFEEKTPLIAADFLVSHKPFAVVAFKIANLEKINKEFGIPKRLITIDKPETPKQTIPYLLKKWNL